jgi:tetratricopeptide (TPR) repeat protein
LFQLVDQLPALERYKVEGGYFGMKESTYDLSIEAYEKALELDPNEYGSRHVLALRLVLLERIDEAIEHFEDLIHRGYEFVAAHWLLARCYAMKGEFHRGYQILTDYKEKNPDSAVAYRNLGSHLLEWGKYEESLEALRKADDLTPGDLRIQSELWSLHILQEDWEQAAAVALRMGETKDPVQKAFAAIAASANQLYRGHSRTAIDLMEQAVAAYGERDRNSAYARSVLAHVLLQRGGGDHG